MQRYDTTKITKRIGKRLAHERALRNETQDEFARRIGVTRGYLSDLERGVRDRGVGQGLQDDRDVVEHFARAVAASGMKEKYRHE